MSTMLSACAARARRAAGAAAQPNWSLGIAKAVASVLVFGTLIATAQPAAAQFRQQGAKLVGTGAVGGALQGMFMTLSADGNTAIVAGPGDNSGIGAVWVFTRNNGVWTQQGSKLVGSGNVGDSTQGVTVAPSADGNTAVVGGTHDNSKIGAAWVFTRSGGVWTQQGSKLVANDYVGTNIEQGTAALSADGNTAIVGGLDDNNWMGATWVFTRSNGVWTQQGSKLFGSGGVAAPSVRQGSSVAVSSDGNTAIVGGVSDDGGGIDSPGIGAAWIFTRSNGVWTQQGSKLVGTGAVGLSGQGNSVALSADGNTAIMGGFGDNSGVGAVWVFTRSNGVRTQQGSKLAGIGAVGTAQQGGSVSLSADGNTAIVGGFGDNSGIGAVWVFSRSSGMWAQQGKKLVGTGAVGQQPWQGFSVALSADGNNAIVGGPCDNGSSCTNADLNAVGAAWVFVRPGAALTATLRSGPVPLPVTFRASGLTLPMTYTVNFGDGTNGALSQSNCVGLPPVVGGPGPIQCSGTASHTYKNAGSYTAALLNASDITLGAVTITAGGNLVRPLHPPLALPGTPSPASPPVTISTPTPLSPPVAISTPTPERHSLDR
jgi:hypothetical protein